MNRLLIGLIPVLALTAACTSTPAAAPAAPSPSIPADGGFADTPRKLIEDGGIACTDYEQVKPIGANAQGTCANGNVVVRVYDDHKGVQAAVEFAKTTGGDLLTGINWSILAEDVSILQAAHERLGGELVHVPCVKPDCLLAP